MTTTKHGRWFGGAAIAAVLAAIVASCGGTGGGGGQKANPGDQFVLNDSNSASFILNVHPAEVDANKSDRIGLVATLSDSRGTPIRGVEIRFTTDVDDITFLPPDGRATTDANGNADIIAIAGVIPTGTGDIIGTGAIFASPPAGFGLRAQVQVTLLDIGFIDADQLAIIPAMITLGGSRVGRTIFFTVVGGQPPYSLDFPVGLAGTATFSQHCLPGCTENGGILCVGSPCQTDSDCNLGGSPTPSGVCLGPISRCLASCRGTNCAGSLCETDADCNDGSATPANVCKDSGQAIAWILSIGCGNGVAESGEAGHQFGVHDSVGATAEAEVTISLNEQCDGSDLGSGTCQGLGFAGGTLGCTANCTFDTSGCTGEPVPTSTPIAPTATPGPADTLTPTPTSTGPSPTPTAGVGVPSNVELALLANVGADNGNATATCIVAATVTDILGNPVPDGTTVTFSLGPPILGPVASGAVISSPSQTNTNPQCDVSNFESITSIQVLNQPGVAHACLTYPVDETGNRTGVTAISGAGSDTEDVTLPPVATPEMPTPTPTPP